MPRRFGKTFRHDCPLHRRTLHHQTPCILTTPHTNGAEVMELRTRITARAPRARLTLAAAAIGAATLALAGCGVGGGGESADADELTVLVEGGGLAELQPVADAYKEETGTTVTLVELPYAGLYDRISTELKSGEVSFDVAALDAIWLTAFADGVTPLDDLFTDEVTSDLFEGLVTEAQVDGSFVGMPVWTNSEILFYRTDLFGDPKEQADFQAEYGYELTPPPSSSPATPTATARPTSTAPTSRAPSRRSGSPPSRRRARSTWCSTPRAAR